MKKPLLCWKCVTCVHILGSFVTSSRFLLGFLAVLGSLTSRRYFSAGVLQWKSKTRNNFFLWLNRAEITVIFESCLLGESDPQHRNSCDPGGGRESPAAFITDGLRSKP